MKTNACKVCQSPYHTKSRCPENPEAVAKAKATKERMAEKARMKASEKPSKAIKPAKGKSTKKKPESRSQLVKKLDAVYSQYVRLDNSDSEGYANCVTCNTRLFWKEIQNGHFISRGKYPTRWHDDNCHPQCMRCNVMLKGNYINYTLYMIDSYGREYVDELKKLSVSGDKISTPDIKALISHYKTEVEQLISIKGL